PPPCVIHHHFPYTHPSTTQIYTLSLHDALPIFTVGTPEGYRAWQSTTDFVYRPDTALRELTQPTLAMFGDHDVLVDWRESVAIRSEVHTSELQSLRHLVCRLLLEKKKKKKYIML